MRREIALPLLAALLALDGSVGSAQSASGDEPNGHRRIMVEHRLSEPAPASLLPEVALMPDAAAGLARRYGGTPIDVPTFHYDAGRTGWNRRETDLTVTSVKSGKFGLLTTLAVDGYVLAQPLLVSGFVFPNGSKHDVLIVATGHDSVFAYDAQTYALLWKRTLGPSQKTADVGCGDLKPEFGITSTPVVVRRAANEATLYVVTATEPAAFSFHTFLHALNLTDGNDLTAPAEIAPLAKLGTGATLTFNPQDQWVRAGLAYNSGSLYVAVTSHCDRDADAISGWLLRYNQAASLQNAFHTIGTPHNYRLASIWMSGYPPAIDSGGNIFLVTGNGDYTAGENDWAESALKMTPTAASVTTYFTPAAYAALNGVDADFGAGGITLLPVIPGQAAPPMAAVMGKSGVLFLLDQDALGGKRTGDAGALQSIQVGQNGHGLLGGLAYFGAPGGPLIYAQVTGEVLHAFSVETGGKPALVAHAVGTTIAGSGGSIPIVSSNGGTSGTGIVWIMRRSAPIELEAYDAEKLGAPIYAANVGGWSAQANGVHPMLTAMEANGRVYAPSFGIVRVFGLTD